MAISQEFKEAVNSKKLIRVHVMLKDSLILDPTFIQFNEMEKYAVNLMTDLYDEHDGEVFLDEKSEWTKEYLNQQLVIVVNNFSIERISLLKRMISYIYSDTIAKKINEKRNTENRSTSTITRKQVGVGMVVGGVTITAAGVVASQTLLAVGGVVIVAAGAVMIASDMEG